VSVGGSRARRAKDARELARALRELGLRLEMEGVPFKPRAFERVARALEGLRGSAAEIGVRVRGRGRGALPGVGRGIAERIDEWLRTGRIAELEALRKRRPMDVLGLTAIEGLGARRVKALHDALGIRSVEDLAGACREGRVRELPGFGPASERALLRAIALAREKRGRSRLREVEPVARSIRRRLRGFPGVVAADVAGSVRRRRDTVGDLDFVAAADPAAPVVAAFTALPEVASCYAQGSTKALVRLASGIDADLRVVPPESYGAALLYFTGSKEHTLALRRRARSRGLKLNEYGLFRGSRRLAGRTEKELYEALGLRWIPPEERERAPAACEERGTGPRGRKRR
jgi:DNA polymerase (family 10)